MSGVENFVFNQTMLRIKDPEASVAFYREVLGMTLLDHFDFPDMEFSLYFMGYPASEIPSDKTERAKWIFEQPALLELTHNYGTEKEAGPVYHSGNNDPSQEHYERSRHSFTLRCYETKHERDASDQVTIPLHPAVIAPSWTRRIW